jgi:hypothetical protein
MTRKELLLNDGYWEAAIDCLLYYKNFRGKNRRKKLIKAVLDMKNELIEFNQLIKKKCKPYDLNNSGFACYK